MLKFNLYLLLKNTKFRVTMIALIVAAIIAGVVMVPKNKAASMSTPVSIVAKKSGLTASGHNYYVIAKNSNVSGYNSIFCIEEGAPLSSKTYSTRYDFYSSSNYFSKFNSASWLVSNMYVSSIQASSSKNALALNLANIMTSDTVKQRVRNNDGFDGFSVTPQDIYNLRNKIINNTSLSVNAMEFAEQIALWKYTYNPSTTFSGVYSNPNQMLNGSTLSEGEQNTLKYMCYAFEELANMNTYSRTSSTIYNMITLNKREASFNVNNRRVGPYYLDSDNVRLTSYNFGSSSDGNFPITVSITNLDGTGVRAGAEIVERGANGAFYINLSNYPNATNVSFNIGNIVSRISTTAYVLDGGNNQNLLTVDKDVKITELSDSVTINIPKSGKYNVILKKVSGDGMSVITLSEATFKINNQEVNTVKGVLDVAKDVNIENKDANHTYTIEEVKAPTGYNKANGVANLNVKFKVSGYKYLIDKSRTTISGMEGARIEVSEENATITL